MSIVHDDRFNQAIKDYIDRHASRDIDTWNWLNNLRLKRRFRIDNRGEAYFVSDDRTYGVSDLLEIIGVLKAGENSCRAPKPANDSEMPKSSTVQESRK